MPAIDYAETLGPIPPSFSLVNGYLTTPGAEQWGAAEWAYMARWAQYQEQSTGYTSVAWDAIKHVADHPELWGDAYKIGVWLGGAWTSGFTPSTTGTVTLEPGEVQTPEGVAGPSYIPPPTVSGSIPPGPSSPTGDGPTTMPINPNVVVLPPTTATGGAGSSGSVIPQILPAGTVPNVVISPEMPAPAPAPAPNNNTMWLLLVAAVVVLYFVTD